MIYINTDATFRQNKFDGDLVGHSETGFVMRNDKGVICTGYQANLLVRCNHEAELFAIKHALFQLLKERREETTLLCDSNYAVNSINYEDYRERFLQQHPYTDAILNEVDQLLHLLPHVIVKWIPREFNEEAHYIASGQDFGTYVEDIVPTGEVFHQMQPTHERGRFPKGLTFTRKAAKAFMEIVNGDWDNDAELAVSLEKTVQLGFLVNHGNKCMICNYGHVTLLIRNGDVLDAKKRNNPFIIRGERTLYEFLLPNNTSVAAKTEKEMVLS